MASTISCTHCCFQKKSPQYQVRKPHSQPMFCYMWVLFCVSFSPVSIVGRFSIGRRKWTLIFESASCKTCKNKNSERNKIFCCWEINKSTNHIFSSFKDMIKTWRDIVNLGSFSWKQRIFVFLTWFLYRLQQKRVLNKWRLVLTVTIMTYLKTFYWVFVEMENFTRKQVCCKSYILVLCRWMQLVAYINSLR